MPDQPALKLASSDRRSHKRFGVARPGKLFRRATQRYEPLTTRNLSFGGALLDLESSRPFSVGELVDLAIAYRRTPLLESASSIRAIVTRVDRAAGDRQIVAVRYIQPAGLAAAA